MTAYYLPYPSSASSPCPLYCNREFSSPPLQFSLRRPLQSFRSRYTEKHKLRLSTLRRVARISVIVLNCDTYRIHSVGDQSRIFSSTCVFQRNTEFTLNRYIKSILSIYSYCVLNPLVARIKWYYSTVTLSLISYSLAKLNNWKHGNIEYIILHSEFTRVCSEWSLPLDVCGLIREWKSERLQSLLVSGVRGKLSAYT